MYLHLRSVGSKVEHGGGGEGGEGGEAREGGVCIKGVRLDLS